MKKNTKKGNYESVKFLAILAAIFIIILIIYFISRVSGAKNPPINIGDTPTPTEAVINTPAPTKITEKTPTPEATKAPTQGATDTPEPTQAEPTEEPTPEPTEEPMPTPTTTLKASEALSLLKLVVDAEVYDIKLLSGAFSPNGDGVTYYRYSIKEKATGKQMQPEMLVHSNTGSIYCYQDGKVFDCVKFPLDETEPGGDVGPGDGTITAQEAVKLLMTFGRDQLQLEKDPSNYTADVDAEPTITLADADGIMAYLIILLDNGRVAGKYAVSVDGVYVYIIDPLDENTFIRIIEG